ncbi:MAG: dephospho-CoA kinase [Candidatus Phocaeicola faecigallinarum]|uniref:Dephospho-CoA kinase n=1 Tax=Candidatus Phocaeicola faecigallinarum TaxID=2838732 RepID=A0A948WVJ3_9BACT|nr:dephospho-CoA kinase [Candidatus Phocaeicola faecigallinarum]
MKTIQLSPAQLTLLESFANIESQAEADELSRVIRDYYARKLDEELDKLWDDGTLDQQKLDKLRSQHLRTPYKQ